MTQSPAAAPQLPAVERASAAERIIAFLRAKHPVKTPEHVSADTGLSAKTVKTWFDRTSVPNAIGMIYLVGAYGPEFLAAAMGDRAPQWLTSAGQDAELARLDAEMAALKARREALANR